MGLAGKFKFNCNGCAKVIMTWVTTMQGWLEYCACVCVCVCVCVCFCVCVCLPTAPSLHRNESCQVYRRIHVTHLKVMSHREI